MSAPEPLPRPTTKEKQRRVLRVCIDTLVADNVTATKQGAVIEQLKELLSQLRNRRSPPAPISSAPMTPELAAQVRAWHGAHSDWTYQRLAMKFNINIGRVSEAVKGKRT